MTNEEIRIKVAEAMGWKPYKPITHDGWPLLMTPPGKPNREGWLEPIPDYLNDLNACAEFEKTMTDQEHNRYRAHIYGMTFNPRECFSATARQRAEAFIRTLNLWKD